jgi:hypothetical protein
MQKEYVFALIAIILVVTILFASDIVHAQVFKDKKGKKIGERRVEHQSCSNHREVCEGTCGREAREREPKQRPPVPTTPTPEPPFARQTTTTTPSEVRCASTNDCNINSVCCQNVCRKESEGICRDINGDGIPDWLVYIV